jgi:hypothetical protein
VTERNHPLHDVVAEQLEGVLDPSQPASQSDTVMSCRPRLTALVPPCASMAAPGSPQSGRSDGS